MGGYQLGFVPLNEDVSASVNSVFGRTGAVAASVGDYTATQVTNAANLATATTQTFSGAIQAVSASVSGLLSSSGHVTNPPASASVAVSVGTATHNTLGYDAFLLVSLDVTAATTATINAGVGPTSTPQVYPIVTSDSLTGVTTIPMYVPSGYYGLITTSGTISDSATGIWFPI